MEKRSKGYLYALTSLLFLIVWPIFSKLGFGYFNYQTTIVLWFGTAAVFSFFMIVFSGRVGEYKTFKIYWKHILVMGLINTVGVFSSWYALDILQPSLHNFLMKISIVTIVLFGVLFLKEKYNWYEALSGFIIIAGVAMMSFSEGEYVIKGLIMIGIFAICYTLSRAIIKSKLKNVRPLLIVNYRAASMAIFSLIVTLFIKKLVIYPSIGLLYATLPAILSAVFAHIFIFRAYKLIEISKVELIISAQPFLVLIPAFFVFGEVLSLRQIFGGIIIIVGVIGLIYSKKLVTKTKNFLNSKNKNQLKR